MREVGVIEPLVVYPELGKTGMYMLLDGHVRPGHGPPLTRRSPPLPSSATWALTVSTGSESTR